MIDTKTISELRSRTAAGIVDCKKALEEAGGDLEVAAELLRKKGIAKAGKKGERATNQGLVEAYVHGNGKVGVLVEVLCETDFVARNEQFRAFVHDLALQIAAANPLYVNREAIPPETLEKERELSGEEFAGSGKPQEVIEKIVAGKLEKYFAEVCLLDQPFIKDEDVTIGELLQEKIATIGENMQIKRFVRFALGE
ncbi:elongation factor Ts [Parcubacteria bacterium SG8_24]|nr:MAG: elongation factor Ts [Parcubacteria bacterium SG8_24]